MKSAEIVSKRICIGFLLDFGEECDKLKTTSKIDRAFAIRVSPIKPNSLQGEGGKQTDLRKREESRAAEG